MNTVSEHRDHRLIAVASVLIALTFIALLALAGRAEATETIYWDNYGAEPESIGFADITGSGGGQLNLGTEKIESPEGMAYDTVTNRLFVANEAGTTGQILAINLNGSGAAPFTAPGAPIEEPEGVAVDPATRMIYWENVDGSGSIAWAKLDGSAGGVLNLTGAPLNGPCCRLAVDPAGGRVYWVNTSATPHSIGYANVNNTGGGTLNLTGSTVEPDGDALAVDSAGRLYYTGGTNQIGFANLNGSGGGDVSTTGGVFNSPWGMAFDPSNGHIYWGNESNGKDERTNAIGFVALAGGGGGISPLTAPVDNPQDPVIIKSPTGAGAPTITRNPKDPSELTCSSGGWAADFPGGFVYQAPRNFAYQWTLNGSVLGSGPERITASPAGSYACTVTATNQSGSAAQTSAPVTVKATKVKLSTKKRGQGRVGKAVGFKIKAVNQGDISTRSSTKICVKLPKASKADLKAPKCKKLGALKGHAKKTLTLKIKVKPGADEGTDKVTFQVKGSAGKAAKSKIVIG